MNDIDKAKKIFDRKNSRVTWNYIPVKIRKEFRDCLEISKEIKEIEKIQFPGNVRKIEKEKFSGISVSKNSRMFIGIDARKFDTSVTVENSDGIILDFNILKSVTCGDKEIPIFRKIQGSVVNLLSEIIEERKNSQKDKIDIQARKDFRSVKYPKELERDPIETNDVTVTLNGISINMKTGKMVRNSKLGNGIHLNQSKVRGK